VSEFGFEDLDGNAKPAENPNYMGDMDFYKNVDLTYHSRLFKLTRGEGGDNQEYREIINRLLDPDEEHLMAYPDKKRNESWTPDGELMVHLEYLEIHEEDDDDDVDADLMDYG